MHIHEAKAAGYEVDTEVYPIKAYGPGVICECFTEMESLMLAALCAARSDMQRMHVVQPLPRQTGFKEMRLVCTTIDLVEMT